MKFISFGKHLVNLDKVVRVERFSYDVTKGFIFYTNLERKNDLGFETFTIRITSSSNKDDKDAFEAVEKWFHSFIKNGF